MILGCSFAYGYNLKDEKTLSYKLSKLTNRTVYNRAIGGASIQHAIMQAEDKDFYKNIKEPEYVIYVYNSGLHIPRLYEQILNTWENLINFRFEIKNGKLIPSKDSYYKVSPHIYKYYTK